MVPRLHKKGSSFKGAAAYLLHDKEAETAERVAWTATRNLAVSEPEVAWRIMAATAIDQNRLKELAGIKATGRKSSESVLHLTLSWHPDEKSSLSREEMERAAQGAIEALGASDHQALIIAHSDEIHPHLHILINRVNPQDGRMLSSSKEKLNLSRWAEAYEKERGQIRCEVRVENNKAREAGIYTRGTKSLDRKAFEAMRSALANDNRDAGERLLREKQKDAALAQRGRKQQQRHRQEWQELNKGLRHKQDILAKAATRAKGCAQARIKKQFEPVWRDLKETHQKEVRAFDARETRLIGKVRNVVAALKHARSVRGREPALSARDLLRVITSKKARRDVLVHAQAREHRALEKNEREVTRDVIKRIEAKKSVLASEQQQRFLNAREKIIGAQLKDRTSLKDAWRGRNRERESAWHDPQRKSAPAAKTKAEFLGAATGKEAEIARAKEKIRLKLAAERKKDTGRDGRDP